MKDKDLIKLALMGLDLPTDSTEYNTNYHRARRRIPLMPGPQRQRLEKRQREILDELLEFVGSKRSSRKNGRTI